MTYPARTLRLLHGSLLLGLLALAACGKGADSGAANDASSVTPAGAAQSGDEQLAELSEYRLTMDKFDKYVTAQRNVMLKAKNLSPAERQAMEARSDSRDNANATVDDMVRNIESEPMMTAAVREAGLSPREFTMITMSLMQTGMAAGVAKMRPNDNQDSLIRAMKANPENVKFLLENEAEITRKQKDLEAEMKRLGATDEES